MSHGLCLSPEVWDQGAGKATLSWKALGKDLFHDSPSFCWLLAVLWVLRSIDTSFLPLSSHGILLCVQNPPSYKDTSYIGLGSTLFQYDIILTEQNDFAEKQKA